MSTETTLPLSPEREAEIRERASAATAGPWGTYHENPQSDGVRLIDIAASLQDTGHGYRCRRYIAQTESGQIDNDRTHRDWGADQDNQQSADDAEFIAHAREDIPALLAEIERLRGEVEDRDRTIRYFDQQSKRRKAELQNGPSANAALLEAKAEVVAWLDKKAGEHRRRGRQYAKQADVIERLASKVERGAIRTFLAAETPRLDPRSFDRPGQRAAARMLNDDDYPTFTAAEVASWQKSQGITAPAAETAPICPVCQRPGCCCSCFGRTPRPDCTHGGAR